MLKLSVNIREGLFSSNSLSIKAVIPYFTGEMYYIHPIQPGVSSLFLNTPVKIIKGRRETVNNVDRSFASNEKLPINSPRDDELK